MSTTKEDKRIAIFDDSKAAAWEEEIKKRRRKKLDPELLKVSPADFKNLPYEQRRCWFYAHLIFRKNDILFKALNLLSKDQLSSLQQEEEDREGEDREEEEKEESSSSKPSGDFQKDKNMKLDVDEQLRNGDMDHEDVEQDGNEEEFVDGQEVVQNESQEEEEAVAMDNDSTDGAGAVLVYSNEANEE